MLDDLQDELEELLPEVPQSSRIKIAVLDTGFQLSKAASENFEEQGRIRAAESHSFISSAVPSELAQSQWRLDKDGHGTNVATIVLKVCPMADVHVAQVFRTRKDLENPRLGAQIYANVANVGYSRPLLPSSIMSLTSTNGYL